ncbi:MAG: type II 3-dehydroquinate dehydratase [Myxococcales bacterium]|nr:type II 3-dehydroquinate dehydratase [Myxococcales bacterium]
MRVWVLNGPNLNLLGSREPQTYGTVSLDDWMQRLQALGPELGIEIRSMQSNGEGQLVDWVQQAGAEGVSGLIVNAGGYTHTSVALRDALLAVAVPFVEVHVSNVWARESFRHVSLLSDVAVGVVAGLGGIGYELALRGLLHHLNEV